MTVNRSAGNFGYWVLWPGVSVSNFNYEQKVGFYAERLEVVDYPSAISSVPVVLVSSRETEPQSLQVHIRHEDQFFFSNPTGQLSIDLHIIFCLDIQRDKKYPLGQ